MDLALKPGDIHVMISHGQKQARAFRKGDVASEHLWDIPALTEGVGGGPDAHAGSTPFGDYAATGIVPTTAADTEETRMAYGSYFISLSDLEGQESSRGRAGIGIHGGGTALGPVGSQMPNQALVPTLGCCRLHNADLVLRVVPLVRETLHAGRRFIVTVGA